MVQFVWEGIQVCSIAVKRMHLCSLSMTLKDVLLLLSIVVCVYWKTAGTLKNHYLKLCLEIISSNGLHAKLCFLPALWYLLGLLHFKFEVHCINHCDTVVCRCELRYSGKNEMFIPCNFFYVSKTFSSHVLQPNRKDNLSLFTEINSLF